MKKNITDQLNADKNADRNMNTHDGKSEPCIKNSKLFRK